MSSFKRNWQIIYSNYNGPEKKAVELVCKEMSALIVRDPGVYTIYTLACIKEKDAAADKNSVIIGTYDESDLVRKYISREEIPGDGYVVKVMDDPEDAERKLVILTALNPREVFYAAVDFVDDYFAEAIVSRSNITFFDELFTQKLKDYYNASKPVIKNRNIFTWAHPISDYRNYIDNMARLKFNELILWNDYVPINARDVVEYAHEYGIRVIWGYAWGWSRNCNNVDFENLKALTEEVIKKYEDEYLETGADGIYFQSFTELRDTEYIGDKLIAEVVCDFVNDTVDKLLKKYPELLIQFGLHATTVNKKLEYIAKVDKRIDIIWEDCGSFPYDYGARIGTPDEFTAALKFTTDMLTLRDSAKDGVLYKGHLTMDWEGDHFAHQAGHYIMGMESARTNAADRTMEKALWKDYQANWLTNGELAYDMTRHIASLGNDKSSVGVAGQLANGIWFPTALLSQILWECDKPYSEILNKVLRRRSVDMV